MGTDGYMRQAEVEELRSLLLPGTGHRAKSRDGKSIVVLEALAFEQICSKSRIASLGMPLILLILKVERKYMLDSLRACMLYDGRDYSHQHGPSIPDTDIAS